MLFLLPACGMNADKNTADTGKNNTTVSDSADKNMSGTDGNLKQDVDKVTEGAGDVVGGAAQGAKDMVRDLTDGVDQGTKDLEKAYNSTDRNNNQ